LIWYSVVRCKLIKDLNIIVATSDRPLDDPIAEWADKEGLGVFRGSANDVSLRVLNCIQANNLDYFFRVNADSPFLEPLLLLKAHSLITESKYDFVTNLMPRSFPYGVSVECFDANIYRCGYKSMYSSRHFEHPTSYFYEHISSYSYYNIACENSGLEDIRLTVDTPQDLDVFSNKMKPLLDNWLNISYIDAIKLLQGE